MSQKSIKRISAYLSDAEFNTISNFCLINDISMSKLLRILVLQYINQTNLELKRKENTVNKNE